MGSRMSVSIVAGVGALTFGLALYIAHEHGANTAIRRAHASSMEHTQALPDAASEARRAPAVVTVPIVATATARDEPQREVAPPSPEGPKPPPATSDDQAAYVDSVFTQQAADPRWSREAERALDAALKDRVGSSRLEGLECRESLCRARVTHMDESNFSGFIDRLVANSRELWQGPILSHREPDAHDGKVRTSVYFGKPDTELPAL
jgi:hypothetical protein